jgi:HEPN domain-containing protein
MSELPDDFLAARGYLSVARGDREKGFFWSACLTAQKAGEAALQAYVRSQGMRADADSMPVLVAEVPGRTPDLERAAALLERFRMDMVSPYRSFAGPDPDPTAEAAALCCQAAEAIVAHVAALFGSGGGPTTARPAAPPAAREAS